MIHKSKNISAIRLVSEESRWRRELAECGLLVMACDVVPLDAVGVEVVEDGQADLVPVAIVRLSAWGFSSELENLDYVIVDQRRAWGHPITYC